MWLDIIDYNNFYTGLLGKRIAFSLAEILEKEFLTLNQQPISHIVGYGYMMAIFNHLIAQKNINDQFTLLFPSSMGGTVWSANNINSHALICDHDILPFGDMQCDYIILCHALEHSKDSEDLLKSCHDALNPNGKLIIIVPARQGIWARSPYTPFGQGKPYSLTQLRYLLRKANMEITKHKRIFHTHPYLYKNFLKLHQIIDIIIKNIAYHLGGVLIVEAQRSEYIVNAIKVGRQQTITPLILQET